MDVVAIAIAIANVVAPDARTAGPRRTQSPRENPTRNEHRSRPGGAVGGLMVAADTPWVELGEACEGCEDGVRKDAMEAHRIETIVTTEGELKLTNVPVHVGDTVEVIVRVKQPAANQGNRYPLRGSVVRYDDPFEPVAEDDWEVLR